MRVDASRYFPAMVEFARECTKHLAEVSMTIVDLPEVDVERARKLIEDDIGAVFRRRPYF